MAAYRPFGVFKRCSSPTTPHEHKMLEVSEIKKEIESSDSSIPKDEDNLDRRTLFVRSIPLDASSEELSEYFSQFVPVKHAVIVTDGDKNSRGFGFVSFTLDDDTLTALVEAKKNKFKNRLLRVDIAKRRDRKDGGSGSKAEKPAAEPIEKRKARLIVRNLPWTCDADKLKKTFLKFGGVHDAYIPSKKGGLKFGFGFVVMNKKVAADRAVKECKGLKIDGREVSVSIAIEKSKWDEAEQERKNKKDKTVVKAEIKQDDEADDAMEQDDGDDVAVKEEEMSDINDDDDDNEDDDTKKENEDFDQLNGHDSDAELDDEDEEVEEDDNEEDEDRPKSNKQEAFSVFVRNIPYDADKDTLQEHFSHFGPVKYALPVVDKATGVARGSAFVAFKTLEAYENCLNGAPTTSATSMLISDDVAPEYVYQGRILSIASTVDRNSAAKLAERNSTKRKEALGFDSSDKDRRNLYLLNEGRITQNSKLAQFISNADMEAREKSYKLRVQQLNKNPTLHLSLTRLAIRNIPRAMTSKSLKALGRKAVVQFATEVKAAERQPLSKEEVNRSIKHKLEVEGEPVPASDETAKKNNKKLGVVRQAKIIMEVKGTGDIGRSRGYGFLEFRDHKAALMGLRWLNAHEVTDAEIVEGMTEEEKKLASLEGLSKRRLIVEFAIENAKVVKRRRDQKMISRHGKRSRDEDDDEEDEKLKLLKKQKRKGPSRKGNMNKGPKGAKKPAEEKPDAEEKAEASKSGLSDSIKHVIARKRKNKKGKN